MPQYAHMRRSGWRSGLWSLAVVIGCGSRIHAGAAAPLSDPALTPALQAGLHASTFYIAGASLRGFASPDMVLMATGLEVGIPAGPAQWRSPFPSKRGGKKRKRQFFSPHAVAGVHALQLDFTDGASFGAGSPYLQLGISTCRYRGNPHCFGLVLDGTHVVRFHEENHTWLGVSLMISRFWDDIGG
ncbi:MAG: hypothetical protein CL927_00555 [Deltaproteobacteria bacterium]|nr:hypothetical protein [Deltaproteobacteria bacterium]HCH66539.1 hypothetical protein [Deltaproteobacteria bacterium]